MVGLGGAEDGGGGEDGGAAELHRQGGVGGGADAGVEDDRDLGALGDDRDVVRVADAGAGADRRAERHHGGAADLLEAAGEDRVVVGVGEDGEAVGDELLGGVDELDRVGEEGAVVADHLELDPVGLEGLAGELGGADGVAGGVAAGGVGEDEEAEAVDHVEDRAAGGGVDAAQGDGDDLGAGGGQRLFHLLERAEAAGAGDQARGPLAVAERPGLGPALDRGEDLDRGAVGERRRRPLASAGRPRRRARPRPRGRGSGGAGGARGLGERRARRQLHASRRSARSSSRRSDGVRRSGAFVF